MINKIDAILLTGDDEYTIDRRRMALKKDYLKKGYGVYFLGNESTTELENIGRSETLFEDKKIYILKGSAKKSIYSKYFNILNEEVYKLPKTLYKFLESLGPKNWAVSKRLLSEILTGDSDMMIFAVLIKHVRDLIWVKTDPSELAYPEWRLVKLRTQSDRFSLGELKAMIKALAEIDLKLKSSQKNFTDLLDLMMIRQLK